MDDKIFRDLAWFFGQFWGTTRPRPATWQILATPLFKSDLRVPYDLLDHPQSEKRSNLTFMISLHLLHWFLRCPFQGTFGLEGLISDSPLPNAVSRTFFWRTFTEIWVVRDGDVTPSFLGVPSLITTASETFVPNSVQETSMAFD